MIPRPELISDNQATGKARQIASAGSHQPVCALLAVDPLKDTVLFASENCSAVLGISHEDILATQMRSHFGTPLSHAMRNLAGLPHFSSEPMKLGDFEIGGRALEASGFKSAHYCVIEFAPVSKALAELSERQFLDAIVFMTRTIENCETPAGLLRHISSFLRHISGYDRAVVGKIEPSSCSGSSSHLEVLFDASYTSKASLVGRTLASPTVNFCRVVWDATCTNSPITTVSQDETKLDLSLASSRPLNDADRYMAKVLGSRSIITLPLKIDGKPWGFLWFANPTPRIPSAMLRQVFASLLPLIWYKLGALLRRL